VDAGSWESWVQPRRTAQLILKEKEPGEGGVHVSVKVRCSVEQLQPDLVASFHADDDDVGGGTPVRDALCPDSGNHRSVLHYHHGSLQPRHTPQLADSQQVAKKREDVVSF